MKNAQDNEAIGRIIESSFEGVNRLFLDTAPLIYYVENHPLYVDWLVPIFSLIDSGRITAVTSPVSLAECLVHPYRRGHADLQRDFTELIVNGKNTVFVMMDHAISQKAAKLRAEFNLSLLDAFQVATALSTGCDVLLTNDSDMKIVADIKVIVLGDMTGEPTESK